MEPILDEDCQVVAVQHAKLGKVLRLFRPHETMQSVYDCVGSISHDPCFFKLCEPLSTVRNIMLRMVALNEPIHESAPDDIMTFSGHHIDLDEYDVQKGVI